MCELTKEWEERCTCTREVLKVLGRPRQLRTTIFRCQWQSIGGMGVHSALCVHTVFRVDTWASTACVEASP